MIKTIIVEDEERSLKFMKRLLDEYCREVEVVGSSENVDEAYDLICRYQPDLVFLDIELRSATAFQLLKKFDSIQFNIIFTTAYEQYALQAIKFNALDYLLKPVDPNELMDAIAKVVAAKSASVPDYRSLEVLLHNLKTEHVLQQQMAIATGSGLQVIKFADIIYLESDGPYTTFYLRDSSKIVSSKNLKTFEAMLPESMFLRSHNSYIINTMEILKYLKTDGGQVIMSNQATLNVSKSKKDELLARLNVT